MFLPPFYRYQKMVEQASDGRLTFDTKIAIVTGGEAPFAIGDGRIDMGSFQLPIAGATFPLWDYGSLPFFFANLYEYEAAAQDPRMAAVLEDSFAEVGLVRLADWTAEGFNTVWSNTPIKTVDDFKNLKIRTGGLLVTMALKEMGAAPMDVYYAEVVDALGRGTVDAAIGNLSWSWGAGFSDVSKYAQHWPISAPYGYAQVINQEKWHELPEDLQKILIDVGQEVGRQCNFATDLAMEQVRVGLQFAGVEYIIPDASEIDKARQIAKPTLDNWLQLTGPAGAELLAIASDYASGGK